MILTRQEYVQSVITNLFQLCAMKGRYLMLQVQNSMVEILPTSKPYVCIKPFKCLCEGVLQLKKYMRRKFHSMNMYLQYTQQLLEGGPAT